MDTTETKSAAYHRLVNDGRWPEAQKYRLAQRDIFLSEGKHRDEARELSWAALIQEYPTPDDEMRQLLDLAGDPPYDSRSLTVFRRTWFAAYAPAALAPFAVDGKIPPDVMQRAMGVCERGFDGLLCAAIREPQMYIDMLKEMIQREIDERRTPPSDRDEEVAVEMEQRLREIPEIEAAVQALSPRGDVEAAVA